jgi:hypothetical protein
MPSRKNGRHDGRKHVGTNVPDEQVLVRGKPAVSAVAERSIVMGNFAGTDCDAKAEVGLHKRPNVDWAASRCFSR